MPKPSVRPAHSVRGLAAGAVQGGFTMVELIAVIVLLGILSATAYSRLGGTEFEDAGYRDQISATLTFARKTAVAQRRNVRVKLNTATNVLELRIAKDIPEGTGGMAVDTNGNDVLMPGGSATSMVQRKTQLTGPDTLWFGPLGMANVPAAPANTYVYTIRGSATYTVTVDANSGHVY